ncbi:MAG: hypothetical protein AVDCRST_MAG10-1623, partial [uncultured Acidimicrobiales bacterium]
ERCRRRRRPRRQAGPRQGGGQHGPCLPPGRDRRGGPAPGRDQAGRRGGQRLDDARHDRPPVVRAGPGARRDPVRVLHAGHRVGRHRARPRRHRRRRRRLPGQARAPLRPPASAHGGRAGDRAAPPAGRAPARARAEQRRPRRLRPAGHADRPGQPVEDERGPGDLPVPAGPLPRVLRRGPLRHRPFQDAERHRRAPGRGQGAARGGHRHPARAARSGHGIPVRRRGAARGPAGGSAPGRRRRRPHPQGGRARGNPASGAAGPRDGRDGKCGRGRGRGRGRVFPAGCRLRPVQGQVVGTEPDVRRRPLVRHPGADAVAM